jgi:hypothetical protein
VEATPICSRFPIEVCTTMTCTCNDDILIEPGWIKARFGFCFLGGCSAVLAGPFFVRRQKSRRKDSTSLRYRRSCWMGTLRGKGGSLCQLTLSMIPSLVILFAVFAAQFLTFPYQLKCHGTYVIHPEPEKLYSNNPVEPRAIKPKSNTQRSTRKSHRADVGFCQNIVG